jgi:hypothetical protein
MGSIGDCYDNAMIEAFWSRMQVELLNTRRWRTRVELANAIFEYIEIFHNRRRRHSALGMRTPIDMNYSTPHQRPPESRNAAPRNRGQCEVSTEAGALQIVDLDSRDGVSGTHRSAPPVAAFASSEDARRFCRVSDTSRAEGAVLRRRCGGSL